MLALSSVAADAQGRRRGPVGPPRRAVVVGGFYSRPLFGPFFDPWFQYPFGGYPPIGYPPFGAYRLDNGIDIRLQVTPRDTQVYVDGFSAGTADDFDGVFQRLHLTPGGHEIVLYLPNYRTVRQSVYVNPGGSHNIKLQMAPLGPGESTEPPPTPNGPPGALNNGPRYPPAGPPGFPGAQGNPPSPQSAPGNPPGAPGNGPRNAPPGPPGFPGAQGNPPPRPLGGQPAADRFGSLSIRVQPGDAQVTVDGELWQGSDARGRLIVQLPEGTHHVEIRKNGFETFSTDVQVRAGEMSPLNVSLPTR